MFFTNKLSFDEDGLFEFIYRFQSFLTGKSRNNTFDFKN